MKKMFIAVMMFVVMMSNVALGATPSTTSALGEYEKSAILNGTYQVVEPGSRESAKAHLGKWSDPDLFGNQYRIYSYTEEGELKLVTVKHKLTKDEKKALKAASKK